MSTSFAWAALPMEAVWVRGLSADQGDVIDAMEQELAAQLRELRTRAAPNPIGLTENIEVRNGGAMSEEEEEVEEEEEEMETEDQDTDDDGLDLDDDASDDGETLFDADDTETERSDMV
eukprot:g1276.t1